MEKWVSKTVGVVLLTLQLMGNTIDCVDGSRQRQLYSRQTRDKRDFYDIRWTSRAWFVDSGQNCRCGPAFSGEWTAWSSCSSKSGMCYAATQFRIRTCQKGCTRIQTRNCLDMNSCTGTWKSWFSKSSCAKCRPKDTRKFIRVCMNEKGDIGPYCREGNGRSYEEKSVPCNVSCPNRGNANSDGTLGVETASNSDLNVAQQVNHKKNSSAWIQTSTGHLVIILVAVIAGILLVALIFVTVLLVSLRRRISSSGGSASKRRLANESTATATTYVSSIDKDSSIKMSDIGQQQKATGHLFPWDLPQAANSTEMTGVRGPVLHTDSLVLVRKHVNKGTNKGSVGKMSKLLREKNSLGRRSADDRFLRGISQGDAERATKQNTLTRRATYGTYDTNDEHRARRSVTENTISYVETTFEHEDVDSANEKERSGRFWQSREKNKTEFGGSMNGSREKSKIRLSVEDIRRIFEGRSAGQTPIRSRKKSPDTLSKQSTGVDENISRFEQACSKTSESVTKRNKFFGSFRRRKSQDKATGKFSHEATDSKTSVVVKEESYNQRTTKNSEQNQLKMASSSAAKDKIAQTDAKKPSKNTFLFSPQAHDSLQRTAKANHPTGRNYKARARISQVDRVEIEKMDGGSRKRSNTVDEISFTSNEPFKNPEHVSSDASVIAPRRSLTNSFDFDTYADVWDAKVKAGDNKSHDSVYADVWDSKHFSRRSLCQNDDDDYSEVYDAATVRSANARSIDSENHNSQSYRHNDDDDDYSEVYGALTKTVNADIADFETQNQSHRPRSTSSLTGRWTNPRPSPPLPPPTRNNTRTLSSGSSGLIAQEHTATNSQPSGNASSQTMGSQADPIYCVI